MHDFLLQNQARFDYFCDPQVVAVRIMTDKLAAEYEELKIAAHFLKATIRMYRQKYPQPQFEEFSSDSGEKWSNTIEILFTGKWTYGHFLAIVPMAQSSSQEAPASSHQEEKRPLSPNSAPFTQVSS